MTNYIRKNDFAIIILSLIMNIVLIYSSLITNVEDSEYFINDLPEKEFFELFTEPYENFFNIPAKIEESSNCDYCRAGIEILQKSIYQNYYWEHLHLLCTNICNIKLRYDICSIAVRKYGPVFLNSLIKKFIDPEVICTSLRVCSPKTTFESPEEYVHKILQSKPNSIQAPKSFPKDSKNFTFIQLADVHFQIDYKENTMVNCEIPLCCRNSMKEETNNNNKNSRIYKYSGVFRKAVRIIGTLIGKLGISGFYNNKNSTNNTEEEVKLAGKFGAEGNCDSNLELLKSFAVKTHELKPDFILYTGDVAAHNVWEVDQTIINNKNHIIIKTLENVFNYKIPIYPTVGNHEKAPPDIFNGPETVLLHNIGKEFKRYLSDEAYHDLVKFGYYSTIHKNTNLRIVSLNGMLCDTMNFHLWGDMSDTSKMFNWLNEVLHKAESNKEIVYLIDHMPKTISQYSTKCAIRLTGLLDRYQNIIRGYISGHIHSDMISLVSEFNNKSKVININFISPGLTTYPHFWPSFREFIVDSESKYIKDFVQYRLNLTESNLRKNAVWYISYVGTKLFNVTSLTDYQSLSKYEITDEYMKHHFTDNPAMFTQINNNSLNYVKCFFHKDNNRELRQCPNIYLSEEAHMHYIWDLLTAKWETVD